MKILLIGERYSSNLGDSVICESVKYIVEKCNENIEINFADLSCREVMLSESSLIKYLYKIIRFSLRKLRKIGIANIDNYYINTIEYKYLIKSNYRKTKYDLIIFCGGQLFMDHFTYAVKYFMNYSIDASTNVIFNAIGNGMKFDSLTLTEYINIFKNKNIKSISFRDSFDFIKKLNEEYEFNVNPFFSFDPALFACEAYGQQPKHVTKINNIGLGVINLKDKFLNEHNVNIWIKLIALLNKGNYCCSIFVNGSNEDFDIAKSLYEKCTEMGLKVNIEEQPKSGYELTMMISKFDLFVSYRLHSHIIGYSLNIPSISISWDKKVSDFFAIIDRSEYNFSLQDNEIDIYDSINMMTLKIPQNDKIVNMKENILKDFKYYLGD